LPEIYKMITRYKFSLGLSLVILFLSLKNADSLNKVQFLNIPHFDKMAHTGMYFALMSVIVLESLRSAINLSRILLLSIFPFLYGILLEILQSTITTTRNGSLFDVIFNTLGILISILLWTLILKINNKKIR